MRTDNQIRASQNNGRTSRGPVSIEGKTRSSQNAVTHGSYKKVFVLSNEVDEMFEKMRLHFMDAFQPQGTLETDLVNDILICRWRLHRTLTLETAALDFAMDRQRKQQEEIFQTIDEPTRLYLALEELTDKGRTLTLLHRQEAKLRRTIERATEQLLKLQAERKSEETEKRENEPREPAPACIVNGHSPVPVVKMPTYDKDGRRIRPNESHMIPPNEEVASQN